MSDDMIPNVDVPEDDYREDPDYDPANDEVDSNEQGVDVHPDTNISGAVETSLPGEAARREDQK